MAHLAAVPIPMIFGIEQTSGPPAREPDPRSIIETAM